MPACGGERRVGETLHFGLSRADVGGDELRARTCRADVRGDGVTAFLVPATDDDEGALGGERRCDRHSEAARGAGDQCCAACQPRTVWTHESTCSADKNGPASP